MARPVGPLLLCGALVLGMSARSVDARSSAASLRVVLTAAERLSTPARGALIEEATRIWDRAGVELEWVRPAPSGPLPPGSLRLLAVARGPVVQADPNVWVLGELLRFQQSKAIARVSVDAAETIVGRWQQWAEADGDVRLGVIIGRAAAHEIGHYLLDTSTHAPAGLMRARIDEREFGDLKSDAFDLDERSRARLKQRIADGLPLGPVAGARSPRN